MKSQQEWARELEGEVAVPYLPRAHFVLPLILSRREALALVGCEAIEPLGRLALRTLYATGVREEELAALEPDCRLEGGLRIGGSRPRTVLLDEQTARELAQLGSPMFPGGVEALRGWLARAAAATGVAERFAGAGRPLLPKALRHAYATHCVEGGMDFLVLFYQMGHDWIDTTEMYAYTAVAGRGAGYASSHPLMKGQTPCQAWLRATPTRALGDGEEEDEDPEEELRGLAYARLSVADMWLLIAAARTEQDRLVVRLLWACGLRLAELLALRGLDLVAEECRLMVRDGKGGKDRYLLIDPETVAELRQRGTAMGEPILDLKRPTVQKMLTSLAARAGLTEKYAALGRKVTTHAFRHTYATHCYLGGMDFFALRLLLGHSRLATTLVYLDCPWEHREQVYSSSHGLIRGARAT